MSDDGYSSDEEEYTKTSSVQLGFVDIEIPEDPESKDDIPTFEDTLLGGKPVWLHEESAPAENLVTCDNCGKKMALYLQAFSPIDLYDRVLYVFGCANTRQCSRKKGSVKAIRGIRKDPERIAALKQEREDQLQKELDEKLQLENKAKLNDELTKNLFSASESTNPFGNNTANPFGKSNPFDTVAKKETEIKPAKPTFASVASKKADNQKATIVPNKYELPTYPGYFVFTSAEKFRKVTIEPELQKYKELIDNNSIHDEDDLDVGGSSVELNPQAAKVSTMLEDKVFENFSNTVQHNPSQILRYDLGGSPLLYNGKDDVYKKFTHNPPLVPNPAFNPSSERQFEIQIMPKAILDLEESSDQSIEDILNGMSWGTIIVCTDKEDFIPEEYFDHNHVAYIEEYCAVQYEESV